MSVLTGKRESINREFRTQPYRSFNEYQKTIDTDRTLANVLDPGVAGRMFSTKSARISLEGWRHSSDPSRIDGNKIFAKSITADEISAKTITIGQIADGATITTFRQSAVPTALSAGDLFIDTDDDKMYRATNAGDDQITAGEWELYDAAQATGWSHASDVTKIDGGDIYTNTVTATEINVSTLSAIAADVGTLTAGIIADHATAASRKIQLDLGNKHLKVWDDQGTPQLRVQIGAL